MARPMYTVRLRKGAKVLSADTSRRIDAARYKAFKAFQRLANEGHTSNRHEWYAINRLFGFNSEMEDLKVDIGEHSIEITRH